MKVWANKGSVNWFVDQVDGERHSDGDEAEEGEGQRPAGVACAAERTTSTIMIARGRHDVRR